MTNLTAAPGWDDVPQIEVTTPLKGGPAGPLNAPAQALLNRTEYLVKGGASNTTLEAQFVAGETDWSGAAQRACLECYQTGKTLRLVGKAYPGARLELHGTFSIEGNGATVDYLGIGTTLIAGTGSGTSAVPTVWPNDPSYDAAGLFNPIMRNITAAAAVGDSAVTLASAAGLAAGQYLFLADKPTSASSAGNYIPTNFEFAKIKSIAGNVVTFFGRLKKSYTTSAAAFYSAGLAVGGSVRDLRISTSTDAYQHVVRSAINVTLDNIEFIGTSAIGGCTFAEGLRYQNLKASGAYGCLQTARGTVSCFIDGVEWQQRTDTPAAEQVGIFIEESFDFVSIRNVKCDGGALSIRSCDMTNSPVGKRRLVVADSMFDTSVTARGADSPFQCGTAAGFDLSAINVTFKGTVVTPTASTYPGVSGSALAWVTGSATTDTWTFSACKLVSTNAGASFKKGSGALCNVRFDALCGFETCAEPVTDYTPRGAWSSVTVAGSFTTISGFTAPAYRVQDKTVYLTGAVQVNSAASGDTCLTLPAGARPVANKLLNAGGAQTGAAAAGSVLLTVDTSGAVTARWTSGVAYFGLEGISFPLDV